MKKIIKRFIKALLHTSMIMGIYLVLSNYFYWRGDEPIPYSENLSNKFFWYTALVIFIIIYIRIWGNEDIDDK